MQQRSWSHHSVSPDMESLQRRYRARGPLCTLVQDPFNNDEGLGEEVEEQSVLVCQTGAPSKRPSHERIQKSFAAEELGVGGIQFMITEMLGSSS